MEIKYRIDLKEKIMPTLHSYTHCQVAQAETQTQIPLSETSSAMDVS